MKLTLFPALQIATTCWLWCTAASAQTVVEVGQLLAIEKQGEVTFQAAAASNAATAPAPVNPPLNTVMPGGTISTGADGSATVIISGAGTANLERNTEVRLPSANEGHSLELLKGKLFLQINAEDLQKRQTGEFRLKTPSALLAVKGTRFFVDCGKKSETVGLHEGKVIVTEPVSNGTAELLPGQAVSVSPGSISLPGPFSAKDKNSARAYDTLALTRTPLVLTFDVRNASGSNTQQVPAQYFYEGRLLAAVPANLNDWEFLRFHNFTTRFQMGKNGRSEPEDSVRPMSITPAGAMVMATTYHYEPVRKRVRGKIENTPPVFGTLPKSLYADLHFKGRAWRSTHVRQSDVGPLLGLQLRVRLKSVGRVTFGFNTTYSSTFSGATLEAPLGLPEAGVWERDCIVPITLNKSGEDSSNNLNINVYPEGPTNAAGKGTVELTILDCALVSKSR